MKTILAVDDNADISSTEKEILSMEGFTVETACNGEDFLGKIQSVKPDLVLLDIMMPGLTTRQILERLKKMGMDKVKIIFVTVVRFSDEELNKLKAEHNIVDYIKKPFNIQNLIQKVKANV